MTFMCKSTTNNVSKVQEIKVMTHTYMHILLYRYDNWYAIQVYRYMHTCMTTYIWTAGNSQSGKYTYMYVVWIRVLKPCG